MYVDVILVKFICLATCKHWLQWWYVKVFDLFWKYLPCLFEDFVSIFTFWLWSLLIFLLILFNMSPNLIIYLFINLSVFFLRDFWGTKCQILYKQEISYINICIASYYFFNWKIILVDVLPTLVLLWYY